MEKTEAMYWPGGTAEMRNAPEAGDETANQGVAQHYDDGAHVGMDVAEDADDAGAGEGDAAGGAGRIEADVEDLAAEVGEGVVEDGIEVGEIDGGSDGDGQDVGREGLVFLDHRRAGWLPGSGAGRRWAQAKRRLR